MSSYGMAGDTGEDAELGCADAWEPLDSLPNDEKGCPVLELLLEGEKRGWCSRLHIYISLIA